MILDAILVEIASSSAQKFVFVSKATSKATMNNGRLGQNNFLLAAGGSPGTNSLDFWSFSHKTAGNRLYRPLEGSRGRTNVVQETISARGYIDMKRTYFKHGRTVM